MRARYSGHVSDPEVVAQDLDLLGERGGGADKCRFALERAPGSREGEKNLPTRRVSGAARAASIKTTEV